ncbi:DoxX family protein [Chitinophaga agrisoli]|uniref:DoxX family protein n=1 Tax=Chitinophaga agrisoli TaxID=2607653 RepID=A0A5B2VMC7_9BACT|nr:DoxX family protein [Chitinophaga agrisoli]KAA2240783.1 DoxX family protein [Chitinophaga agrisoli]
MTTATYNPAHTPPAATGWKEYEKIILRVFFIYFLLQLIPLDWKFYRDLFAINWLHLQYGDIFHIAHYLPRFFGSVPQFTDGFIFLLIAIIGSGVWTYLDRRNHYNVSYDALYYWLRVLLRYRLAIALLVYGLIKFFPLQSPYPSLSNLNTPYGDFTEWKLFSLSLGIVPGYETFLGLVEILAAALLLYRKTASVGAFIVLLFTGNVFMSNLAYGGGEAVYSFYLVTLALFLFAYDLPRLVNLLALGRPTAPPHYKPAFDTPRLRYTRLALKTFVILFFGVLYGAQAGAAATYQYPTTPGLSNTSGLYNVREFRLNNQTLPYSDTDAVRWQDVVFEKWATISIRSNRPVTVDSTNVDNIYAADKDRTFELEGSAARHYYNYTADTAQQILTLHNRNKHHQEEQWVLHYNRPNDSTLILSGANQQHDSVYVVLDRINKKYLLEEVRKNGRGRSIKL